MTIEKRVNHLEKRMHTLYHRSYASLVRRANSVKKLDEIRTRRLKNFETTHKKMVEFIHTFNMSVAKNKGLGRAPIFLDQRESHRLFQWLRYKPLKNTPDSKMSHKQS